MALAIPSGRRFGPRRAGLESRSRVIVVVGLGSGEEFPLDRIKGR
jgi:hypothetical protein